MPILPNPRRCRKNCWHYETGRILPCPHHLMLTCVVCPQGDKEQLSLREAHWKVRLTTVRDFRVERQIRAICSLFLKRIRVPPEGVHHADSA